MIIFLLSDDSNLVKASMKNSDEFYINSSLPFPSSSTSIKSSTNTNNNPTVDDEVSEAILQVTYADRIIINKIDLITQDELIILFQAIKIVNKNARILACEYSNIPIDELLNIRAFDPYENKSLLDNYDENYDNNNNNTTASSTTNTTRNVSENDIPKIFTTDENGKIIIKKYKTSQQYKKQPTNLNFIKMKQNALQIIKKKNYQHNISSISLVIYDQSLDLFLFNDFIIKLLKEDGFLIYRLKGIFTCRFIIMNMNIEICIHHLYHSHNCYYIATVPSLSSSPSSLSTSPSLLSSSPSLLLSSSSSSSS